VPGEHGTWGNAAVECMLRRHPWLGSLVAELREENVWSAPHRTGGDGWVALFFEDTIAGQKTTVSLEMKPSRRSLQVPAMPLREEGPPSLLDVERWIIKNIRVGP